jgi:glyoxylase-like metal-dependent hydrolase (beta-lactamase superfamily II)
VIHAGDVLFQGKYPFIDTDNGGTIQGYIEALGKIAMIADNDTKIIPGHGDIAKKSDLRFTANMLTKLYKQVSFHYANRKTEAEIINMRDFTKTYDDMGFGDGFISTEKILQTIYTEVKKERGEIDERSMEKRLRDQVRQQKEGVKKDG